MAGTAKTYGVTFDYVLYEMSYANVLLYSAIIPEYRKTGGKGKGAKKDDVIIDADDPRNREVYLKFVNGR